MKKIRYLLLLSGVFLFTSCPGALDVISEAVTPKEPGVDVVIPEPEAGVNYYTLQDNPGKVTLPTAFEDKDIFLIYTNTSSKNEYASSDTVSIPSENTSRSATSDCNKTVIEKAVVYDDGFYRNDVHYDLPEDLKNFKKNIKISNSRSVSRTVSSSGYYNPALPSTLEEGSEVDFFYNSGEDSNGNDIVSKDTFTLKKIGNKCRIWVLNNNPDVIDTEDSTNGFSSTDYDNIANVIDNQYVKVTSIFGSNVMYGGNVAITTTSETKLEVLVYDINTDATHTTNGGTFGFFWSKDFIQNSYLTQLKKAQYSNECQLINIDSYFLKNCQDKTLSTLIHEFQHLLNFINKDVNYSTWYTEMLSMSSEDIFLTKLGLENKDGPMNRLTSGYFGKPYQGFGNWGIGDGNDAVYYSYANAYAFGAFLMRNYGGVELIHKIATNEQSDTESIINAIHEMGPEYQNETFESVFFKFAMTFIYTNSNEVNSLNKQVNQTFNSVSYTLNSINLDNGSFYCGLFNGTNDNSRDTAFNQWAVNNLYIKTNEYSYSRELGVNPAKYWYKSPKIFKSNYKLTEPVRPYGFVVYYLGHSGENQTYTFDKYSNLTATIVAK